jgi:TatD DNase family protein
MPMLVDAHAHLDHYEDAVLEVVLSEIVEHQIWTLSNAMDVPSYRRTLEIASRCELVLPSFGIHPWRATAYADRLDDLQPLIDGSPILGEIGLDYHWVEDRAAYPAQREVFEFFLSAAGEQDKVVNLHTKGAEAEILDLLDSYQVQRAIVHWYSGPLNVFHEMVDRGMYFTIGVEVLHSEQIRNYARILPLDQLLTETDNPGGLEWLTGTPGMPHHVRAVVEEVARLRQIAVDVVVEAVHRNLTTLLPEAGDPTW